MLLNLSMRTRLYLMRISLVSMSLETIEVFQIKIKTLLEVIIKLFINVF